MGSENWQKVLIGNITETKAPVTDDYSWMLFPTGTKGL
jgi:hypothetical protein